MSLSEINSSIAKWLSPITQQGKEWCKIKLSKTTNDFERLSILSKKAKIFSKIAKDAKLESDLLEIASIESELKDFSTEKKDKNELEKESTNELLFLGDNFHVLNFVPFLLATWATLRIYIFPAISMLIPLLVFILPYFIIRFMMKLPLTIEHYFMVLRKLIGSIGSASAGGNMGNGLIS